MVDLMMWLVIAVLLLAAALQGIGYYQRAAYFYNMQTEVSGVAANAHASASLNGGTMDDTVLSSVVADNNTKNNKDSIVVTYGSIMATAAGPVEGSSSGFELASVVTATSSDTVYYLKASSTLVTDKYVVYFFKGTPTYMQGVSVVGKSGIDGGGTEPAIIPGSGSTSGPVDTATPTPTPTATATASPSPTATVTPTPTPTATPSPTATATPTPVSTPSIVTAADLVAYDANGELWNYGTDAPAVSTRKSISPAGAVVPTDAFVTDWNSDGIQDLVIRMADGTITLRKGLANGGFTDSQIGTGWTGYDITIGKWKKADTYPSILAKQTSTGDLYLYPNAYGTTVGSTNRSKIFTAWGDYSPLNLVDWDQDGNMDLIGRNSTNDLWVFRTNGSGSFLSATGQLVGGNWTFGHIRAISGRAGAGTTGLMARDSTGNLFYYPILGSSWGARTSVGGGWSPYKIAGN